MAGYGSKDKHSKWQQILIQKFARNHKIGCATFSEQQKCRSLLGAIINHGMADSPLKVRVRAARVLQRTHDENGDGNHAPRLTATTQDNSAEKSADDICVDHEAESSGDDEMEVH